MRLTILTMCGALLTGCAERPGSPTNEPVQNSLAEVANQVVPTEPLPADAPKSDSANAAAPSDASPCLIQDGEQLRITPITATGTEPFWSAQAEGRCVTYSTPEDQKGTRIWTRFNPGPDGGVWTGSLDGKPFKLVTRVRQGCSDGMSDRSYPMDATLTVRGEERRGCAAPNLTGKVKPASLSR